MATTNVNKWAMYSEVENFTDEYNMGFITRREYANHCYAARVSYIGKLKNMLLYIRDRWF